jgi:hypothetical protein
LHVAKYINRLHRALEDEGVIDNSNMDEYVQVLDFIHDAIEDSLHEAFQTEKKENELK